MWNIIKLPHWRVRVDLCLEEDDKMIQRIKGIRYICRLIYASWIPRFITSGSELGWDLGFELGSPVGIVLGEPVGYPIGYSINMFLGLELGN